MVAKLGLLGAALLALAGGGCIRRSTPALTTATGGPVPPPEVPIAPRELKCPPATDTGMGQSELLSATSQIARWPILLRQPPPPPQLAGGQAGGAVVELQLDVDDRGAVRRVRVTQSARPDLDAAAQSILAQSLFAPACTPGGLTISATLPWRYRFP